MTQPYPPYPNIELKPLPPAFTHKVIAPLLEPIIYELAVKNPSWMFTETNVGSSGENGLAHVRAFAVTDDKDNKLGSIELARNYGRRSTSAWVFEITNKRISQSRERGYAVSTANPKVALKTINKYFGPPNLTEKLEAAATNASHGVYSAAVITRENHDKARRQIQPAVSAYVRANWAQVLDSMKDSDRAVAETIPAIKDDLTALDGLLTQIKARQHLTVLIEGDTYITHDGGTTQTYGTDDLPTSIKVNVGLLKLMEIGKPAADIGIRVSDTTFVLYKGAKHGAAI